MSKMITCTIKYSCFIRKADETVKWNQHSSNETFHKTMCYWVKHDILEKGFISYKAEYFLLQG